MLTQLFVCRGNVWRILFIKRLITDWEKIPQAVHPPPEPGAVAGASHWRDMVCSYGPHLLKFRILGLS